MRIACPHCGQPGKIRTSRTVTPLTREAYVQCENIRCCFAWKIIISAVTTIAPSLSPNPEVFIRPAKKTAVDGAQLSLLNK